jgi:hypothetical protein
VTARPRLRGRLGRNVIPAKAGIQRLKGLENSKAAQAAVAVLKESG